MTQPRPVHLKAHKSTPTLAGDPSLILTNLIILKCTVSRFFHLRNLAIKDGPKPGGRGNGSSGGGGGGGGPPGGGKDKKGKGKGKGSKSGKGLGVLGPEVAQKLAQAFAPQQAQDEEESWQEDG